MNNLNSLTITNAPPEKLIDLRFLFDDKLDEIIEGVEQENYYESEKKCEEIYDAVYK